MGEGCVGGPRVRVWGMVWRADRGGGRYLDSA